MKQTAWFNLLILNENSPVFVIYYNAMHYSTLLKLLHYKKATALVTKY